LPLAATLAAKMIKHLAIASVLIALPAAARGQELMPPNVSGWTALAPRASTAPGRQATNGTPSYTLSILGNGIPNVYGGWTTHLAGVQAGASYRFRARAVPFDIPSVRESVTIIVRWRGAFGDEVAPDYVWSYKTQSDGSLQYDRTLQAPPGADAADVELVLQWAASGRVSFDSLSFMRAAAPAARPVRAAAVYFRPSGTSSGYESVQQAASYADQVASANRLDVMVLGEMLNVIGAAGSLDSKAETIPGPSTDLIATIARGHSVNIAFGLLEKEGNSLYNTAVLIDRSGTIKGKHRKVQVPLAESSAGIAPGDAVEVFDADFGRVALLICQDTAFAEPVREAALQGAELLLVPIWGGKTTVVRARAAEHGIYLAASGYDYVSEIVGPVGTVLATVASTPGVAIADLDLSQHFREMWLGDWHDIVNKERRTSYYKANPDTPPPPPGADATPPTVSVSAPASGATVSGSVNVTAAAADNVGVASVTFLVDGAPLAPDDTIAPYEVSWDTRTVANGSHTLIARASDAAGNVASASVTVTVSNSSPPPPPTGKPIPGTVQAEDYDQGGEGVAYHDTSPGNNGGQYRSDDVDIEATGDAGGGFNVGWMGAGEWLAYTVSVQTAGTYTLTARVAASGPGGNFHVEVGGANVTGSLRVPDTGDWQNWTDVTATVTLKAGVQPMRFVVDALGSTGIFGNLNYIRIDPSAAPPPTPADVVLYATDLTRHGAWTAQADASAAGGQKTMTPDNGIANTAAALANPSDYVEATFATQAATVTFATAGPHTIRIQVREDGAQIDQVILSPSRYSNTAPGPGRNDNTIVPKGN
jgi:predicted amidohydrolase